MLQPLRGPFFLYDLPRNAKELLSVEKRLGYAPVALHLQQKGFEEQSNYHLSPGYAAEMEMIRMLKEQNRLLTLDGEKPVANLVESVVRHLRVHGTREMLKNDAEKKAARAKKAAEDKAAREYLEGATIKLAEGLHKSGALSARAELQRTEKIREHYIEPRGWKKRLIEAKRERLDEIETLLTARRMLESADGGGSGIGDVVLGMETAPSASPRGPPTGSGIGMGSALFSSSSVVRSSSPQRERSLSPKPPMRIDGRRTSLDGLQPRIDLQLSPRNWSGKRAYNRMPDAYAADHVPGVYAAVVDPTGEDRLPPPYLMREMRLQQQQRSRERLLRFNAYSSNYGYEVAPADANSYGEKTALSGGFALRTGPAEKIGLTSLGGDYMRLDTSEGAPPVKEQLKDALQKNLARVMDLFRELDVDSNGMVSIMEFRQALPLLFGPDGCPEEVADELFVSFDKDGGGTVDYRELQRALR